MSIGKTFVVFLDEESVRFSLFLKMDPSLLDSPRVELSSFVLASLPLDSFDSSVLVLLRTVASRHMCDIEK